MKKFCQVLFIFFVFLLSGGNLMAQSSSETSNDSIASDKGDLNLLAERVYLAFKAYRTGVYESDEERKDISIHKARLDSLRKEGWIIDFTTFGNKKHILPVVMRGEKPISEIDMTKIPADSVRSIEVMDGDAVSVALYGVRGVDGVIVRLKE